jgi:hypothetical protein
VRLGASLRRSATVIAYRHPVLMEALLLGATAILSLLAGLIATTAWPWAIPVGVLAIYGIILSRSIPQWGKIGLSVLLPCWWIFSQLSVAITTGSGSYDIDGRKGVYPTQVEPALVSPLVADVFLGLVVALAVATIGHGVWRQRPSLRQLPRAFGSR